MSGCALNRERPTGVVTAFAGHGAGDEEGQPGPIAARPAQKGGSRPRRSAAPVAGGRTTKIHALSDGEGRPFAFLLTGGQAADCRAAEPLLERLPPGVIVNADRAYDSNVIRRSIEAISGMPNIPPKANRRCKNCFPPFLPRPQCH